MKETADLGLVPAGELKERMRPGGEFAITAAPKRPPANGLITATCETHGGLSHEDVQARDSISHANLHG